MKKVLSLLALMLICISNGWAQTKVQGVVRTDIPARVQTMAETPTGIDFNAINYWVGNGRNEAAFAVKWTDGKTYVWGYRWSGSKTGADMISAIAAKDPRFYLLVNGGTWSYTDSTKTDSIYTGDAIGGIGYNANITSDNEGDIRLVSNGTSYQLTNGVYDCGNYTFDSWTTTPAGGLWNAGWYTNGYWSYWNADSNSSYSYAMTGCSGRKLTKGCVDGWAFAAAPGWQSSMDGEIVYVSKPTVSTSAAMARAKANAENKARAEADGGTTIIVNTIDELAAAIENAASGDTIAFDKSLKGDTIIWPADIEELFIDGKALTLDGNGVVITESKCFNVFDDGECHFKNFVFDEIAQDCLIAGWTDENLFFANITIENCVFKKFKKGVSGTLIDYANTDNLKKHYNLTIKNCLFENCCISSVGGRIIDLYGYVNEQQEYTATIINNTFVSDAASRSIGISGCNNIDVKLINNVFERAATEKTRGLDINIDSSVNVSTSAYNVIHGTISKGYQGKMGATDTCSVDMDSTLVYEDGVYKVIQNTAAYHRLPANTAFEGIDMPGIDIYGNAIDYTADVNSGCSQLVKEVKEVIDYTKGTFILNEDWYGHQNSTINFLTDEGKMIYRVIQRENEGVELGCTSQYGTIYGGKMYIMSKQDKDPGATIQSGRLTICDAKTMKVEKQFPTISANGYEGKVADGRGFLGVNEHKAYVGTSNGIFVFNTDTQEFTDFVTDKGSDEIVTGEMGNMIRVADRVFAIKNNGGLLVINPETDEVEQTIYGPDHSSFGTMTMANDGNLYISNSDSHLYRLNPITLEDSVITAPEGIVCPGKTWYAWTPGTLCASRQHNVVYWATGGGFMKNQIAKYDIDNKEFSIFADLTGTEWNIYGCSFRINPVTDDAVVSLFKSFGDPTYITRIYDNTGAVKADYKMEKNYWFPSLPIFPDNCEPTINDMGQQQVGKKTAIDLTTLADDADNMTAEIVKTIKEVSNESVLTAKMENGSLLITPIADGSADIVLNINSNGKLTEATINVVVSIPNAIATVTDKTTGVKAIYNLNGQQVGKQKGLNIIRMSDGSAKKVIRK